MRKIIAALSLSAIMLSLLLTSCASDKPQTTTSDTTEEAVASETAEPVTEDGLPITDWNGEQFRVYIRDINIHFAHAEEMNGEVVNDAVFAANQNVEERYNVDLVFTPYETTVNSLDTTIGKMIYAGDDSFDIVSCHDNTMGMYSLAGYLLNVNNLPYIDYSQPWWPKNNVESMTVGNTMHLISASISYNNLSQTNTVYANKSLLENYNIPIPYDKVLDESWTLDYFIEITKDVYNDLNGNSQSDDEDLYGFVAQRLAYRLAESFGLQTYKRNNAGELIIDINNSNTVTFIDKYYDLCFESKGGDIVSSEQQSQDRFTDEKALFIFGTLAYAVNDLRHTEIDYGFLPMPKLNEMQDGYLSGSNDVPFGVPVTNTKPELTGFMIEAMNAEGYRTIQPAFFEVALKQKFTTDSESMQMLDIISDSRVIDFGYLYSGASHPLNLIIPKLFILESPSKDFASFYAKHIDEEEAQLARIIEAFEKNS